MQEETTVPKPKGKAKAKCLAAKSLVAKGPSKAKQVAGDPSNEDKKDRKRKKEKESHEEPAVSPELEQVAAKAKAKAKAKAESKSKMKRPAAAVTGWVDSWVTACPFDAFVGCFLFSWVKVKGVTDVKSWHRKLKAWWFHR